MINTFKFDSKYKEMNYAKIAQFNCFNKDINDLFKKKLSKIHATSYIFTDKSKDDKIIAFLSICASSIQVNKKGVHVFPAVELKLFGVDKDYQNKKIIGNEINIKYVVCPVLNAEYLVLFSVPDKKTLKFYEKMKLEYIEDNQNIYKSNFSSECIPMYLKLNSKPKE